MRRYSIGGGLAAERRPILGAADRSAPRTDEAARAIGGGAGDHAPPVDHHRYASGAD